MGKLPNGPFNGFTGKVGNLVCYDLNGQTIIRTIGINNKPPTIKQHTNRMKMKVINELVQNTYLAMHAGFTAASAGTVSNYANLAIKHNNPNALKGVYPNVELDYPKLLFSHGNLETPIDPKVEVVLEGLKFSWDPSTQCKGEDSQDQVSMVAYCPEKKEMLFIKSGQKRHQGFDILPIGKAYKGLALEIYMYFIADDRLDVSTTTYLGRIDPTEVNDKFEPLVIEQIHHKLTNKVIQSYPIVVYNTEFKNRGSSFIDLHSLKLPNVSLDVHKELKILEIMNKKNKGR
jgi:hypothetical protein